MKIIIEISDWEEERDIAEEIPTVLNNIASEISEGMTKGGNVNTPYKWNIQTEDE